jgi:hypothetical protein
MNGLDGSRHILVEFFYPIFDNDAGLDICGDLAIVVMLKPLVGELRSRRLVSSYEFMRYSVGGYHLRVKFYGEKERLAKAEFEIIRPALDSFREKYAEVLANPMILGDFSVRLHERLDASDAQVHRGGEYVIKSALDVADLYEDEEVRQHYLRFGEALCDLIIDMVEDTQDLKIRKTFARILLMDMVDSTGLKPEELHYVLLFIKRQWEKYFLIGQEDIERLRTLSITLAPRFHEFLAARNGVAGSAAALPKSWRQRYIDSVFKLSQAVPDLIRFGPHGVINNNTALRLLSIVHLVHNRLGLDISQEVLFAEIAGGYFERQLNKEELANTQEWVERNLSQYFEEEQKVIY